jgi:hypothetical protein
MVKEPIHKPSQLIDPVTTPPQPIANYNSTNPMLPPQNYMNTQNYMPSINSNVPNK